MSDTGLSSLLDGVGCPKRFWVMLTLSDDELISGDEPLPLGLMSHLAHCEPCQALAGRIRAVRESIDGLAELEPDDDLQCRVEAQARAALKNGAELTGRVDVAELEEPGASGGPCAVLPLYWPKAAAAVILIAVGLFWASQRSSTDRPLNSQASERSAGRVVNPPDEGVDPLRDGDCPRVVEVLIDEASSMDDIVTEAEHIGPIRPPRAICRHHSHIEAAMSEHTCIDRAVILPGPAQRNLGWSGEFDNPAPVESTEGLLERE